MRILLACLQALRVHPVAAYDFWAIYFKRGIEEGGHEWVEVPDVDWVEALTLQDERDLARWREETWTKTVDFLRHELKRKPVDIFLGYLYPQMVDPGAIQAIRELGIPCVNFFCDNVREFRRVPADFHGFDLHWVPEFEALPMYRKAHLPHLHAPMPCWVPPELRTVPLVETEPPTFIGSVDILRRKLLGEAIARGADIAVRGQGWNGQGKPQVERVLRQQSVVKKLKNQFSFWRKHGVASLGRKLANRLLPMKQTPMAQSHIQAAPASSAEYFRITREASVTIGINRVPITHRFDWNPLTYSRLRDVEAPMLGACYLTEWTAGLAEIYELGTEVESYRTVSELVAKIAWLQKDPARRARLRQGAQRKALTHLSVSVSVARIADQLGIGTKGRHYEGA